MASSTTEYTEVGKAHRCAHCGGPLKFGADDIVYTCPYCGYTSEIDGEPIEDHCYYSSVSEETVKKNVTELLARRKVEKAEIIETKVVYLPFWCIQTNALTKYKGYMVSRVETDHKKQLYLPLDESSSYSGGMFVLARRSAAFYGLEKLKTRLGLSSLTAKPFSFEEVRNEIKSFLNAEINGEEAHVMAKSAIEDEHRREAEILAKDIVDCRTEVTFGQASYLHVPLYMIRYCCKGKLFKIALDGRDGTLLLGEMPMTFFASFSNLVMSFSFVIASAILGAIGPPLILVLLGTETEGGVELILVVGVCCLFFAFLFLKLALDSLRKFFNVQIEYGR